MMRILYVEDNPANLSLLQRIARMGGHEVITYTEGESALENFDKDKPDLVLMDVQLAGGLSGLDVVRQLRARGHKMPIIAVTAYAMTGDRERCLEAGCDTYISKPLPVGELVELVQRYEKLTTTGPEIKPLSGTAISSANTPAFVSEGAPPKSKVDGESNKVDTPPVDATEPERKNVMDATQKVDSSV